MKYFFLPTSLFYILIGLFLSVQLAFADESIAISESDLVGEWHSSKAMTIIEINADGTWSIKEWDQSGLWAFGSNKFVWIYNGQSLKDAEDINQILSYTKEGFTLRELDGSITVFSREE